MPEQEMSPKPPQEGGIVRAIIEGAAKVAVGSVPGIGPAAAEFLGIALARPAQKRQAEWFQRVFEDLQTLSAHVEGLTLEAIAGRRGFQATFARAARATLIEAREERRMLLRNAVLNAALNRSASEDEQDLFMQLVETLTPGHVRLLRFLDNPIAAFPGPHRPQYSMGAVMALIPQALPEFDEARERDAVRMVGELHRYDLVSSDGTSLMTTMSGQGMYASRTTDRGKAFLRFVQEPAELHLLG